VGNERMEPVGPKEDKLADGRRATHGGFFERPVGTLKEAPLDKKTISRPKFALLEKREPNSSAGGDKGYQRNVEEKKRPRFNYGLQGTRPVQARRGRESLGNGS